MAKGDRFLKRVEETAELDVSVLASSRMPGDFAPGTAKGFHCGGYSASDCPCDDCRCEDIRPELKAQLRSLRKYPTVESVPPVVLTHSTDPLFKVTLGLALMCVVIAGFMVGYLVVL